MYGSKRTMPPAGPARKRRRTCAPPVPELPACLLLEILARSDAPTIFRCAATCKLLRREILSADFVPRVCHGPDAVVPSRTLAVLADTFSVAHPITAATAALKRHFAHAAAGLLELYEPLKSRNGLVVLCQRSLGDWDWELRCSADLCVYDPMANSRAFLPFAPGIERELHAGGFHLIDQCALLTAADGIGCSFMLVAADMARNLDCASASSARVRVQTVSSSDTGWGPVQTVERHPSPPWCTNLDAHTDAAVVVGGVVHWLVHCGISSCPALQEGVAGEYILTYDVNAATVGSVDIPINRRRPDLQREPALPSRLASSPDGKLSFVVEDGSTVLLWVLSGEGSWARHARVDMRSRALQGPMLEPWMWMDRWVELQSFFGDRRSRDGAVFLRFGVRFELDMERGATCSTRLGGETGIPYVVDLASRLTAMKSF